LETQIIGWVRGSFSSRRRLEQEEFTAVRVILLFRFWCKALYLHKGYRKPYNRTHNPSVTPPIHNPTPIRILSHRGKLAQVPLDRRTGLLSFISAQSKKRATIRSSLARITSPRRKVPKPGPGSGPKAMLVIAIAMPTAMKRTFRKSN
jgi:hypothetical protein